LKVDTSAEVEDFQLVVGEQERAQGGHAQLQCTQPVLGRVEAHEGRRRADKISRQRDKAIVRHKQSEHTWT